MSRQQLNAPPPPQAPLRADAARNVQRVVEVAARLIAEDPGVGMNEIAEAAGVGRATVYRHFASREVLLQAIWVQVMADCEAAIEAAQLDEGTAVEALGRLTQAWLDIAVRYSFSELLHQTDFSISAERRRQQRRVFRQPLLAVIRRGQASDELSSAVSPEWAVQALRSLIQAGARAVAAGELARADAPAMVLRTLLDGLKPA